MFRIILSLLFICSVSMHAQVRCSACKAEITGYYINVEGYTFHKEHFTCHDCKKVITEGYAKSDGYFVHPECLAKSQGLVCAACNKVFEGSYITVNGSKYHQQCYEMNVAHRCAVCGKPLTSEYIMDLYGTKYHASHQGELNTCANCSRLLTPALSRGGKHYSDGRNICNKCCSNAIFDDVSVSIIAKKVLVTLRRFGLDISLNNVSFVAVDLNVLKEITGTRFSHAMRGFCNTTIQTKSLVRNGTKTEVKSEVICRVYVLDGVPEVSMEATLAHELMHVWFAQNTKGRTEHPQTEGICNYISFLYLREQNSVEASYVIKRLENDPDPLYGEGFRHIRDTFEAKPLSSLLRYAASGN